MNEVVDMRRYIWLAIVAALAIGGSSVPAAAENTPRDAARAQVAFGIDMAREGLWNEAAFRFERALTLDPSYPAAYNNLAVAYEQLGRLDEARHLYERAIGLDGDNPHVRLNHELFVAIDDRRARPLLGDSGP